jgi:hexosaminidase
VFSGDKNSRVKVAEFESSNTPKPIYKHSFSKRYAAGGGYALIDGIYGGNDFSDGTWQGFDGVDADIIINLEDKKKVKSVSVSGIEHQGHWVFFPRSIKILVSGDGENYKEIKEFHNPIEPSEIQNKVKTFKAQVNIKVKYIRIIADNIEKCPDWHLGKGGNAWIFLDEISIEY